MAYPLAYFEIAGPDAERLAEFYRRTLGLDVSDGPFPNYFNIAPVSGGAPGGIRQEEKPECVLYFKVPDLQEVLDAVVNGGGKVVIPPTNVPGVVHFALFEDPSGNRTGIVL